MDTTADRLIELARLRGLIRPCDLMPLEIPRVSLTRAVRRGQLERVGRGLYGLPGREISAHVSMAEVALRVAQAKVVASTPERKLFREAATKYLSEETKSSIDRDAQCLVNLDPWIGHLRVDQVHQGSIQPYIEHRKNQGIKSNPVINFPGSGRIH